jgi:RND family efflux transporter MFP subunit
MRKSLSLLLVAAAIAASGLALTGCDGKGSAEPLEAAKNVVKVEAPSVPVTTVATGELTASLAISGSLSARSRVAVVPKMSGTLTKVLVDIGSRVRAGQTVALQDTRELDAQVDAATAAVAVAKASLEQAEASLANAKLEYDRSKNLFEKGALARQRLDSSDTALRTAKAQRDLAEATAQQVDASFRRAREVRRDAILTAPTSGVVVERNYDSGALVGPGDNKGVVVVADTGELKLQAGVSELDAGRLRVGMPALISVQARPGQTWTGRLVALAPEVDARNRHFQIEVRVQNEKDELLSGMYATASIETGHVASTVLVPREAVTSRDGAWVVYRVVNNVATPVRVTEGLSDGARIQILAGLSAGDVIIADGRKPIEAGTTVRPVKVDQPASQQ